MIHVHGASPDSLKINLLNQMFLRFLDYKLYLSFRPITSMYFILYAIAPHK